MGLVRKIGVIGLGHVGAHVANSLLVQGIADELYLCDIDEAKVKAEWQDFNDALSFFPHNCKIVNCNAEYEKLADCDVVVNAAGDVSASAVNRDGELFVTTEITRTWPVRLVDAGFAGVIVTISNPCDVIATQIWRMTGYDPKKIIGSGTALDSARQRNAVAAQVGLDQRSCNVYMLGEHGFSQFTPWSVCNFGGKSLDDLATERPERFGFDRDELENQARMGGYVTMAGKHCTEYAVASAAVRIVRAVVSNEHYITACATLMEGQYGEEGCYASLPCVVGVEGVEEVINLNLTDAEVEKFHASCAHIKENISKLGSWWETESRVK